MEDKKRWRWKPPDYRKIKELKHLKKDQLLILLLAGVLLLVDQSYRREKKGEKQGISQESSSSQGEQNLWMKKLIEKHWRFIWKSYFPVWKEQERWRL